MRVFFAGSCCMVLMIELVFLIDIRRVLRGKLLEGRKFFLIIKYFLKVELIILPVVDFPEIVLTL
jgi:hypothetical protein